MKKVICTYDEWEIFTQNGKTYYCDYDEQIAREIVLVKAIPYELVEKMTEPELFDLDVTYDVSGELDDDRSYCYWIYANSNNQA